MQEIDQKTHILLVDDTPQNLVSFEAILSELDQHLIFARSAKEALRHILHYDFAVILLDVNMPGMNGFETAQLIRSRLKSSYTPIIFVSAMNKEDIDINEGYAMGAVDFIFKPVNPIILRSKVKVFVDLFTKSSLAVNLQEELKNRQRAEQRARKQKQQLELAELDRSSTVEEMASALAHELNQPLTIIVNYLKGCMRRIKDHDYDMGQITTALEIAGQQAERIGEILHRIKNLVRKNKLYFEFVDINGLIKHIVFLLQEMAQEAEVKINLKLCENIPRINLDKIQIEQVLLNLLRNGIEALQLVASNKRELTIQTALNHANSLMILVKDNGLGINPKHIAKLFDLYFTTKDHGMGVGLSICRTVVEAHGGNISAKNNPQGGACFQLTLPMVMEPIHV